MQVKPGTIGVIFKPKPCCGSTKSLGMLVTYKHKIGPTFVECHCCGTVLYETDIIDAEEDFWTNFSRVKWFNDDLDLTELTEEVAKELVDAT